MAPIPFFKKHTQLQLIHNKFAKWVIHTTLIYISL